MHAHIHAKWDQSCLILCDPIDYNSPGSFLHGFLHNNTRADCHTLLQGVFSTQGANPHLLCLLHWQAGSLPLLPPGKPCIKHKINKSA